MIKIKPVLVSIGMSLLAITGAFGQEAGYPTKPIRIIVPFAPGGGSDALARFVGQRMSEDFGQPVIIDNRPGAGGNIGTAAAARAAPDGYTIALGVIGPITVNVSLFEALPYDPLTDLVPITQAVAVTNLLVVPASLGVSSVQDLIALGKKRVDTNPLTYGTGGPGTAAHLAGATLSMMAGINATHIAYKGSGPVMIDLLAGRVDFLFDNMPSSLPQVQSGALVALAVPTAKRSAALPNIPTVAEAGLEGFDVTNWYGFLAPAGTPDPIIRKLNSEIVKILNTPEMTQKLASLGLEVIGNSPEEFAEVIRTEIPKWRKVIEKSGAKPD